MLSDDETMFLQSLIAYLDPHRQKFAGAFGRECMVYSAGEYYKDLKYLNRDLKNVVLLESNPSSIVLQKENAIFIPNWEGKEDDKALFEILPLLERNFCFVKKRPLETYH